ncbi:MAG: hypothetical protein RLO12_11965 [Fulvivirga sp.]
MYVEYIEHVLEEADRAIEVRDYHMAERLLKGALYDEPGYAKVHNHLGWLYQYYIVNQNQAELHFKYAIRFDPKFDAPYIHLSNMYIDNRRYTDLREMMEGALKVDGVNKSFIYENYGKTHEASGEFSKAIKYYKMAIYETIDSYDADEIKSSIKRCKYKRLKRLF